MADRMHELLQDYDDLVDEVMNATSALYRNSLARWFSLIDETPAFAREYQRIASLEKFDAWYDDLQTRQKSHGIGSTDLKLPTNREAALGIQLKLFRAISEKKIEAWQFAHVYLSPMERNINANVSALNSQLFRPTTTAFRRRLERIQDEPTLSPIIPAAVPASDRIVDIDHNAPTYHETVNAITEIREAVRGDNNSFEDPNEKQRYLAEIETLPILLKVNRVRLALFAAAAAVLFALATQFTNTIAGKLAANAIKKLIELVPALGPFLS